jgi:hypothetical protein
MRMRIACVVSVLLALPAAGSASGEKTGAAGDQILEFGTMVGVAGPFRGATNNIRGVNGAGAAWRLTEAKGELGESGRLEIRVRGLVLVTTGLNPIANFRAIVSCLTTDSSGTVVATSNIVTDPFPATPAGDADIEALVGLPSPCIAPIVFVTNAGGTSWFSVTGH